MNYHKIGTVLNFKSCTLALTVAFLSFSSCNKDKNNDPDYFVTCKINGVETEFNSSNYAEVQYAGTSPSGILINGAVDVGGTAGAFTITITSLPITEREYTDAESNQNIVAIYSQDASTHFEAGTMVYQNTLRNGVTLVNHLRIRLTSITSAEVRGQFSGDFYQDGEALSPMKTITEGEFFVKVQ